MVCFIEVTDFVGENLFEEGEVFFGGVVGGRDGAEDDAADEHGVLIALCGVGEVRVRVDGEEGIVIGDAFDDGAVIRIHDDVLPRAGGRGFPVIDVASVHIGGFHAAAGHAHDAVRPGADPVSAEEGALRRFGGDKGSRAGSRHAGAPCDELIGVFQLFIFLEELFRHQGVDHFVQSFPGGGFEAADIAQDTVFLFGQVVFGLHTEELMQADAQECADFRDEIVIRFAFIGLPVDDSVAGDMQQVREVLLGEAYLFAVFLQDGAEEDGRRRRRGGEGDDGGGGEGGGG